MAKEQQLLVFLLISTVISIIYIIVKCIKKQYAKGIVLGLLMLVTPVFGPILMLLSYAWSELLEKFKTAHLNIDELSFRREKVKIILGDDLQRGINKVPIEEALLESDNENTRKVLLDVLKSDFESSIPILINAIDSEDSEVSHYASAAISDVLSKFKKNQKAFEEEYQQDRENEELIDAYMEYIYRYLSYDVFPETEMNNYMALYEGLMQRKYKDFTENLSASVLLEWITMLVKSHRQDVAKRWLGRLEELYPGVLETYKARLRYGYVYDKEDFQRCLKDIKKSAVDLDEETVELVRFFQV